MKRTMIKEKEDVKLKNSILIEGLPGLGMVGKIAIQYLVKQLKAKKFAYLYSPHFPYYVLVNKKGGVRLLHGFLYYWKNELGANDLILLTGDGQAQTIEGQYEVAYRLLDFAKGKGSSLVVTLGGYVEESEGAPKVLIASTSRELLEKAVKAGVAISPPGNPIVGMAGLLVGMAPFKGMEALCLLGRTKGYVPDPKAAKEVLEALCKLLSLRVDLSKMDVEIERAERMLDRMKQIAYKRELYLERMKREERVKMSYIS